PVTGDGLLDLAAFRRLLGERTRVVAFTHVSNVLGTITPVAEISRLARAAGALTVVDGAQAAPHMPLDMPALDCDFYVFSAHKILGPTGIGVLWGRREVLERLEPTRGGGGARGRGRRGGLPRGRAPSSRRRRAARRRRHRRASGAPLRPAPDALPGRHGHLTRQLLRVQLPGGHRPAGHGGGRALLRPL